MLQSSFTSVLSSALEYSSRLPVSVLVRAAWFNLPVVFLVSPADDFGIVNVLDLAVRPLLMGRSLFTKRPDALNLLARCRNINRLSIHYAFRPRVRVRLTLGGFTFPRKP